MNLDFIKKIIIGLIDSQLETFNKSRDELLPVKAELDGYLIKLGEQIGELEELKKKYQGGKPEATKILIYEVLADGSLKEIEMSIMKVTEMKKFTFKAVDAFGNEAAIENAQWALSEPALGALEVVEKEVTFKPAGMIGECKLQLAVDAKIGEGESVLNGEHPITLIPGDAVAVEIKEVL